MSKVSHHFDDLSQLGAIDWTSVIKDLILFGLIEIAECLRSEKPVQAKRYDKSGECYSPYVKGAVAYQFKRKFYGTKNMCAIYAQMRTELEEVKKRLVIAENLLNLLLKQEDIANKENDKGEEGDDGEEVEGLWEEEPRTEKKREVVYINEHGGSIIRSHVHDLLINQMIVDDIIDDGQEFLINNWREHPERYHKCLISSIMIVGMCITSPSPFHELASTAGSQIFEENSDKEKKEFRFLFTIINLDNAYWHLVVVDMEKKVLMHLNSIKCNAKYKASARKWQKIINPMFHIFCDKKEVMKRDMVETDECPSQPSGSLDCSLCYLKYMNFLARKDMLDH
ncbi:hypothetical protein COCNU_02G019510 [Cocos nucifera]|uniref:Ubiquitin-like protease family profile domain-containing protein n=1 Tax=Cocos nucifera TaxID=13894 RepID=A0A8K0MXY0_COCNU|nr:hypothetical protein COCNU_02G019510 [Cocos nucifera]